MNEEIPLSPSRDEALATLAEVDRIIVQTRRAIAHGPVGPILILWGCIWAAADTTIQFYPPAIQWIWTVLDAIGLMATFWIASRQRVKIKDPGRWRFGVFWVVLFVYGMLWMVLLMGNDLEKTNGPWSQVEPVYRRMASYWHTVPMFAYVIIGMWLGRFLVWLGLLVTVLTVAGLWLAPHYYYLWLAVTGGGSLVIVGIFVSKFWK